MNKKGELTKNPELSRVRPISSEIGQKDFTSRFEKPIPQVGEIKYYEEPEDEERRHYKVLDIIMQCTKTIFSVFRIVFLLNSH